MPTATDNEEYKIGEYTWHHQANSGTEEEISFVANSFDEFLDMIHDDRTEEEKREDEEYRNNWKE